MKDAGKKEGFKSRAWPLGAVIGASAALFLLLISMVFLPVEWSGTKTRLLLWKSGAEPVVWERHRGYMQDRCGGKGAEECPCVWMVHGLGDSVSTWREVFSEKAAFGSKPVRLFAIDLPAHGASEKRENPEEYRVRLIARELNREIEKVEACKTNVLVGNSFGGWVSVRMALDAPEAYSRMLLIAPSGIDRVQPPRDGTIEDVFTNPTVEGLKEFQKRSYHKPRELADSEWRHAVKRIRESSAGEVRKAQRPEDSLDEDLTELEVPTTILWGESDRVTPRNEMELFVDKNEKIQLITLSECGHMPQRECPEKVFPLLRDSLGL